MPVMPVMAGWKVIDAIDTTEYRSGAKARQKTAIEDLQVRGLKGDILEVTNSLRNSIPRYQKVVNVKWICK